MAPVHAARMSTPGMTTSGLTILGAGSYGPRPENDATLRKDRVMFPINVP